MECPIVSIVDFSVRQTIMHTSVTVVHHYIFYTCLLDKGGCCLKDLSISQVIDHINQMLSLGEITAFRLESRSCKGFFLKI